MSFTEEKFSQVLGKNPQTIRKSFFSFALVLVLFLLGFFLINSSSGNIKLVQIAGKSIKVDLAVTSLEQNKGLSGRVNLKDDEGMLFVFAKPGRYSFWMKDMNFPIDMIWIGEDLKVVYIKKNAKPELYPETYIPDQAAKYVLEVVSGFSDKNNLEIGDGVIFTY